MIEGRCLCGDVRIAVSGAAPEALSACHCEMCRKHSGGVQTGFDVAGDRVTVGGAVARYASSDFAERAFCPRCGSTLWFRETAGDTYELAGGLFPKAAGARLTREVYADRAPEGCRFAGDHLRVTAAEYEGRNPHVAEG